MDLPQIVTEIEAEQRKPALFIAAHKKTLEALAALVTRLDPLEEARKSK